MVLGIHDLWLFIASGLLLNITPGPDTVYIAGRGAQLGWRGGAVAALGIGSGCLVHVFAAAVGVSALLAASATAFLAIKLIGGAYLCYIGLRMLLPDRGRRASRMHAPHPVRLRQVYLQGALTNILNPKVALFFLAFLPQFVDASSAHTSLALLLLGGIFVFNGTLWCLAVAIVAARASSRLNAAVRIRPWIDRSLGALFVYLGLRVVLLDGR